jgi:hypothetical protein
VIGRNIHLDPGQDKVRTLQSNEVSQIGVTTSTSGYVVEAAKALEPNIRGQTTIIVE